MNPHLLSAILATTALAGAALVSSALQAMEASGSQPAGAERWRLRPAEAALTATALPPPAAIPVRLRPALDIPRERRAVRMVYPGLLADR